MTPRSEVECALTACQEGVIHISMGYREPYREPVGSPVWCAVFECGSLCIVAVCNMQHLPMRAAQADQLEFPAPHLPILRAICAPSSKLS